MVATLELYLRAGGDVVAQLNERDVVETLNALVSVGAQPSSCRHVIRPFLERFSSLMASRTASVLASSRVVYLCSKLGHDPGVQWADEFFKSTADSLHDFRPKDLAIVLYSWATLERSPPQYWLDYFWMASSRQFSSFITQDFINCAYACAVLGVSPRTEWWAAFFHASKAKLRTFEAQAFANILWACAKVGQVPPEEWQGAYFEASKGGLGQSTRSNFQPQSTRVQSLTLCRRATG